MTKSRQTNRLMIQSTATTTNQGESIMKTINLKQLRGVLMSSLMMAGAYAVASVLGAHDAVAQTTIGGVINNVGTQISGASNLVYLGAYAGGTTALMMGAFKLKAHAENPSQTPMQQGLARLAVGAGLVALPSVGATIVNSSLGSTPQSLASQQGNINVGMPSTGSTSPQ